MGSKTPTFPRDSRMCHVFGVNSVPGLPSKAEGGRGPIAQMEHLLSLLGYYYLNVQALSLQSFKCKYGNLLFLFFFFKNMTVFPLWFMELARAGGGGGKKNATKSLLY